MTKKSIIIKNIGDNLKKSISTSQSPLLIS